MTPKEERFAKLEKWLTERYITWAEISRQCGVGITNSGKRIMKAGTMSKDRRDHFLALGVPEELLPKEIPTGMKQPRRNPPNWPNPEAQITEEK